MASSFLRTILPCLILICRPVLAAVPCSESSLAGVPLICIQKGVGSFSAEDREFVITERVRRLSADQTFDPDKLSVVDLRAANLAG